MNFKNFEDLLVFLHNQTVIQNKYYLEDVKKQNQDIENDILLSEDTKKVLILERSHSPQYLDIMEFLKNDFKNLSSSFKINLINFYNNEFSNLFNEHWMKDFYLFKEIIHAYMDLNYQYKIKKFPYEDKQKYNKRIKTLTAKNKSFIIPKLLPYERIKFFQHKAEEIINIKNLKCFTNIKREKKQYKNELIFNLTLIITDENYKHHIKNKSNMRLTKKTTELYESEFKAFREIIKDKSIKKLYFKP